MPKDQTYSEKSETRPKGEQPGQSSEGGSGVIPVPREVIDGTADHPKGDEYCPPGTPPKDSRA